jgi:hypothetical protein
MSEATTAHAGMAGTTDLGGDLTVNGLGFGVTRLTGDGVWGPPTDRNEAKAALRRDFDLGPPGQRRPRRPGRADAENLIRAAHAAWSYSWMRPPSRSFRRMRRRMIAAGSAIGSGSGRSGRAFAIPR